METRPSLNVYKNHFNLPIGHKTFTEPLQDANTFMSMWLRKFNLGSYKKNLAKYKINAVSFFSAFALGYQKSVMLVLKAFQIFLKS